MDGLDVELQHPESREIIIIIYYKTPHYRKQHKTLVVGQSLLFKYERMLVLAFLPVSVSMSATVSGP